MSADQSSAALPESEKFVPIGRAPYPSKPRVAVTHDPSPALVRIEIAVGERDHKRVLLTITELGKEFRVPETVAQGTMVWARHAQTPATGTTTTTVMWKD